MVVNKKLLFLVGILVFWILFGLVIKGFVTVGYIEALPPYPIELDFGDRNIQDIEEVTHRLKIAEELVYDKLLVDNGHINLYYLGTNSSSEVEFPNRTNSEALSYYLLWNAKTKNKHEFDRELDYIKEYALRKDYNYLMWRLEENDTPITDGANIASDADLRAIKALYLADETWGDKRYKETIDTLTRGLENIAISEDNHFLPYGGVRDGEIWKADEVWLSYNNFEVFRQLSLDKGKPWTSVYQNMKTAVLESQLDNGLFDPVINNKGEYVNTLEEGYSINSLWVMVRAAESKDSDLQNAARKSLEFYKSEYVKNGRITSGYTVDGEELGHEAVWAYALVGRAAVALGDEEFSRVIINEILKFQDTNPESEFYGGFPEGNPEHISQFTLQETILTLQDYVEMAREKTRIKK